ncbi:MAG: hypothetical protein IPN94_21845 [Sphingobacteriales bacterium]|nr:hypothetical protein [Sphingobacteriales bacterium]
MSGVDLEHYALYFYKRMDYTNDQTYNDPTNSGAVYGVIDFADLQPGQTAGYGATPTTIDVEATSQDGIQYGSVAVRYRDCISATDLTSNDVSPIGGTITGIAEGPASIALVYKGSTAKIKDLPYRLGSDNVIQLIGYGTSGPNFDAESGLATSLGTGQGGCQEYNDCNSNTNAGIFTSCDGPAATLVSVDINVVDKVGSSVQFTNICWVNPNVQDPEVDYVLPTANNVTTTGNGIPVLTRGDYTSPGSMNVGLRGDTPVEGYLPGRGNGDELYYDYIAPNGDVMHLDRLCHTLFVGKQTINTAGNYDYDPDAPNEDLDDYYSWNGGQYGDPSNGDVNNDGVVDHNDGDVVEFTCSTMTYTIPFSYQILPGGPGTTQCGSNTAVFFLTVLMDGEENWNNYPITGTPNPDGGPLPGGPDDTDPEGILKSAVCDYTEHNLNTYIDDTVHWIAPIRAEGSYEQTANCTFAENIEDPIISEIEYQHYDYQGAAADDHCVVYNYADDHNTPFNVEDDTYEALQFCEGIEISAGEGTELSCYSLVFYSDQDVDLQSPSNALAYDVWYIGADGMPHKTDVANGVYMQLYGLVDNDAQTWPYPHGTVMTVPAFGLDPWGNNPVYAGANPYSATNQYGQVIAPDQANEGLFIDNNGNDFYNTSDIPVIGVPGAEGWDGTSFPWERGTECTGAYAKQNVGSRWFPVLNIPGHTEYNDLNGDGNYFGPNGVPDAGEIVTTEIGGVGILNHCTGKLVNFISWGANEQDITGCGAEATLCVEANEDFSMAGPFEQLQSYAINTTQNNNLGDLRTLQLVSASIVDGLMGGTCASEHADCNGNVWAIVYNGGKVMIPCCGPDDIAVLEEYFQYSNSIGYYNCLLDDELFNPDPYTCELDLTDAPFSDNYIITSHIQ